MRKLLQGGSGLKDRRIVLNAPAAVLALVGLWFVFSKPSVSSRSSSPEIETARLLSLDLPSSGPSSSSPRYVNLERARLWRLTPPPPRPVAAPTATPAAVEERIEQTLKLHGTFVDASKERSEAVIRRLREDRVEAKHVGDEIEGYRIVEILPREVVLAPPGGGGAVRLRLFKGVDDYLPKPLADFEKP